MERRNRVANLDGLAAMAMIAASIAMIVMAIIVSRATTIRSVALQPYRVGDTFEALPGLTGPALVLWLDTRCRYCEASMAFYRQLTAVSPRSVRLVAAGFERASVLEAYLRSHGVLADLIASADGLPVRLFSTPSVVLLDDQRRIQSIWVGMIDDPGRQQAVIGALR
jgi:hypothetical protein